MSCYGGCYGQCLLNFENENSEAVHCWETKSFGSGCAAENFQDCRRRWQSWKKKSEPVESWHPDDDPRYFGLKIADSDGQNWRKNLNSDSGYDYYFCPFYCGEGLKNDFESRTFLRPKNFINVECWQKKISLKYLAKF